MIPLPTILISIRLTQLDSQDLLAAMTAAVDNQMHQNDDLNLMGLHELDSHLSLFDPSVFRAESSTPGAMSTSAFGDIDQQTHTIVVETQSQDYSAVPKYEMESQTSFADQKLNGIQYV